MGVSDKQTLFSHTQKRKLRFSQNSFRRGCHHNCRWYIWHRCAILWEDVNRKRTGGVFLTWCQSCSKFEKKNQLSLSTSKVFVNERLCTEPQLFFSHNAMECYQTQYRWAPKLSCACVSCFEIRVTCVIWENLHLYNVNHAITGKRWTCHRRRTHTSGSDPGFWSGESGDLKVSSGCPNSLAPKQLPTFLAFSLKKITHKNNIAVKNSGHNWGTQTSKLGPFQTFSMQAGCIHWKLWKQYQGPRWHSRPHHSPSSATLDEMNMSHVKDTLVISHSLLLPIPQGNIIFPSPPLSPSLEDAPTRKIDIRCQSNFNLSV